jgi:hypothetical protein
MFDLQDLLEVVGPTASLVFAAWIFLSYLQQRSVAAFERYRALAEDYRHGTDDKRQSVLRGQIALYKRRCELMQTATQVGVASAILLLTTLIIGALNVVVPLGIWPYAGATCAIVGLAMVIVAASFVLRENKLIRTAIEAETKDLTGLDDRGPRH